uniref:Ig-like domain-containing protein n=1 Tax=Clastoptera arizonana TaxID=38151 RepID=A0A1B6D059_9HEMI
MIILVSALIALTGVYGNSGSCPSVCVCKWKGGKQTVECTDRALLTVPENIDPETQVLDMSSNNLQILAKETFIRAGLLNLQKVYLKSCKLGQIDNRAFLGLTNLVELDMSNNLLTSIPSGTFEDVRFLRELILARNPIQKIEGNAFKTVPGLVKLDLSRCDIQSIAPRAFEGVQLLESLKLNGNKLSELKPKTVETLSKLHGVELHDNPWICDCNLRAAKLWLTNNNIPYPISPTCSGGPDRVLDRTFAELEVDDFACRPGIRLDSRYVEATAGENATILCKIDSIPTAHITWYWNSRQLANNSAFSPSQRVHIIETGNFEKRSTLVITNVQETDSGEFNCLAENRAGNIEANYTLHVTNRGVGMASLGSGQIAGLSAALVILILFILFIILVLLVRLRRMPFAETKTPGQLEVVANGNAINSNNKLASSPITVETSSFTERKNIPSELHLNPIQKPPRVAEISYTTSHFDGGSVLTKFSAPISNPDLINDTKRPDEDDTIQQRPTSGEYNRVGESLYPSGLWDSQKSSEFLHRTASTGYGLDSNDKTPIIDGDEEYSCRALEGYPPDYGLPIPSTSPGVSPTNPPHPSAKTLRVWQRGVPVLPPVTALKRVLTRNSPDEGYQEGCGTDV